MLRAVAAVSVLLAFVVPAGAGERGTILRLGKMAGENAKEWQDDGFDAVRVRCRPRDTACVLDAVAAVDATTPVYLVANARHAVTVNELYAAGLVAETIDGIVLLGALGEALDPQSVAAGAPKLLALVDTDHAKDRAVAAREFVFALRRKGVSASFLFVKDLIAPDRSLERMGLDVILDFAGHSPFAESYRDVMTVYKAWERPPIDNADFLAETEFLDTYPMDEGLELVLKVHYKFEPYLLNQWRLETYRAFDLLAYRDLVAPGARYVTFKNLRAQEFYLDLDVYGAYEPIIVVGIDDVDNMYELAWFYRTKAMYSWRPDVPEVSVRLLGPTLHFRRTVPDEQIISVLLRSALTVDGIKFSNEDPLTAIAGYSETIRKVITDDNNCINCHEVRGFGGRAHHTTALGGKPQGGIGLPLADYSEEVMKAFLYDQTNTANKIGMTPNPLDEAVRDEFYEWYKELRAEVEERDSAVPPGPDSTVADPG